PLRTACAVAVTAGLIAQCGGESSSDGGATSVAPSTAAATSPTTEPTPIPTSAGATDTATDTTGPATSSGSTTSSAADASASTAPPAPIVVDTEFGSFEVPADPERIVVVDPIIALPTALDLGVPIVGTTFAADGTSANELVEPDELADMVEVAVFGSTTGLESIAAADPDLIIASPGSVEEFELTQQIAPSVPFVVSGEWRDDARLVAEALGAADELDEQIAAYDARAAELAARIDTELGDPSVAVVRVRPDAIRVHTNLHFAGNVVEDAGLRIPDRWTFQRSDDPLENVNNRFVTISPELLGDLADADYIIVMPHGRATDTAEAVQDAFDQVATNPLWQTLPAVQDDNVFVADRYWLAGSRRAAEAALDDLDQFLFGGN
ncbi:MAG: iron-siderophore ABC transporter substrate-binding protein, partial [Actinomycetota bacterium]